MIFRRIGRVFRRVASFAGKALDFIKTPVSKLLEKPLAALNKVFDKLPFGDVIKGFAKKFLAGPLAGVLGGPLGGIAAMLLKSGGAESILDIVKTLTKSKAVQEGPPAARNNVLELVAQAHARVQFPQSYA